jgi:predicted nucleotidyltransferase
MFSIGEIKQRVEPIAKDYGIGKLSLFGSYARGQATDASDLDFRIVDDGNLHGLFRLSGFIRDLKNQFNKPIDVVTNDALSSDFLSRIKPDEVVVYG